MATRDKAAGAGLPEHLALEWGNARGLIEKQDERIHQTRTMVFGLFPTLLTAGSILGEKLRLAPAGWLAIHLTLLGLLVTGRFIEQQSHLLLGAAASRAWVLELLSPVELSGDISDRFAAGWAQRTTQIYVGLGAVSFLVTSLAGSIGPPLVLLAAVTATLAYVGLVWWLGRWDISWARCGQDWSFSAVDCVTRDPVSILLVNHGNEPIFLREPAAELRRVLDSGAQPITGAPDAGDRVLLSLPEFVLGPDGGFGARGAFRWVWTAGPPGVWVLQVNGEDRVTIRRSLHVRGPA